MNEQYTPNFLQRMVAKRDQGGFTLIELLIVIIILAILAAIVVFAVGSTNSNAVAASCNADAKSVETAAEAYDAQMNGYPSAIAELTTTTQNSQGMSVGPWLKQSPSTTNGYTITLGTGTTAGDVFVNGTQYDTGGTNPCNTL